MDQLITVLEIGAWSAVVVLPIFGIVRLIAGTGDLVDGLSLSYREAAWPRGVQEEEPVAFRLDHLRPRSERAAGADGERPEWAPAHPCELAPSGGR